MNKTFSILIILLISLTFTFSFNSIAKTEVYFSLYDHRESAIVKTIDKQRSFRSWNKLFLTTSKYWWRMCQFKVWPQISWLFSFYDMKTLIFCYFLSQFLKATTNYVINK